MTNGQEEHHKTKQLIGMRLHQNTLRWGQHVEQELLTLSVHPSSSAVF